MVVQYRRSLISVVRALLCLCACISQPAHAQRKNLGDSINTQWNEIIPIISADGKTLYFDRKIYPLNVGGDKDFDDVWYSELLPNGAWSRAKNLAALNTRSPNAIFSILPDNNTALYWGAIDSANQLTFAIVQRTLNGWTAPQLLHIRNFYNRATGITANLAADGKTLLLSIRRDDSQGGMNIYVSFLEDPETNTWSEPKNLGPSINSRYSESSPLLGADGVTLFFSSGRPGGPGDVNIYVARRLDTTWQHWSEPQCLNGEFNIPGENYLNSMTASGEYAFLSGRVENPGRNMDLFRIHVPDDIKVRPVVLLRGTVFRALKNGAKDAAHPLAARIEYERLRDGTRLGIANTDPATGKFQLALPGGEEYGLRLESDGYLPVSDHLDYHALGVYTEIVRDYVLPPIAAGSTIKLNNIFFDFAKAALNPSSFAELSRLASVIRNNPSIAVGIEGHTDDVGTDEANNALSLQRAQAVKDFLISKGVAPRRISVQGFGKRQPLAPNNTEDGRSKNRRVVFRIVSK